MESKRPKRFINSNGIYHPRLLPKGENGFPLCKFCNVETDSVLKSFCSQVCSHEFKLRYDPKYVRKVLAEIHGGICQICGVNAIKLERVIRAVSIKKPHLLKRIYMKYSWAFDTWYILNRKEYKIKNYSLWHADHVLPVSEGGGECGIENYRTLCVRCHYKETSKLFHRTRKKAL